MQVSSCFIRSYQGSVLVPVQLICILFMATITSGRWRLGLGQPYISIHRWVLTEGQDKSSKSLLEQNLPWLKNKNIMSSSFGTSWVRYCGMLLGFTRLLPMPKVQQSSCWTTWRSFKPRKIMNCENAVIIHISVVQRMYTDIIIYHIVEMAAAAFLMFPKLCRQQTCWWAIQ